MRTLLVMPNLLRGIAGFQEGKPVVSPAMGMMYVSSYLKEAGFDVSTFNLNHHGLEELKRLLKQEEFDAVATGGLFGHVTKFAEIFDAVRELNPKAKCILGGPVATAHPEFALKALHPDYLVLAEGEQTTADLLRALRDGKDLRPLKGIAFLDKGSFYQGEPNIPIQDLDSLPFPDYEGFEYGVFLDMPHYRSQDNASYLNENLRQGYIIGGRDCPGKCTFCFRLMGGRFRLRSVDNIIREIRFLVDRYRVNDICIDDDLFSLRKARIYEFCSRITEVGIPWQCQLRVPGINEDLLQTMKKAGCYLVSYGFESASDTVLKSMRKGIRTRLIERVLPMTRKAGLTMQANFIFGDPAETLKTARETLAFARKYKSYQINLGFIKPYPGSPLYHDMIRTGAIRDLWTFWRNGTKDENGRLPNLTSMSAAEYSLLNAWITIENAQKIYYRVKNVRRVGDGKYNLSLTCPVCRTTSDNLLLERPGLVACPKCYQRSWVDPLDLSLESSLTRKTRKAARALLLFCASRVLSSEKIGLLLIRAFRALSGKGPLASLKEQLLRI